MAAGFHCQFIEEETISSNYGDIVFDDATYRELNVEKKRKKKNWMSTYPLKCVRWVLLMFRSFLWKCCFRYGTWPDYYVSSCGDSWQFLDWHNTGQAWVPWIYSLSKRDVHCQCPARRTFTHSRVPKPWIRHPAHKISDCNIARALGWWDASDVVAPFIPWKFKKWDFGPMIENGIRIDELPCYLKTHHFQSMSNTISIQFEYSYLRNYFVQAEDCKGP